MLQYGGRYLSDNLSSLTRDVNINKLRPKNILHWFLNLVLTPGNEQFIAVHIKSVSNYIVNNNVYIKEFDTSIGIILNHNSKIKKYIETYILLNNKYKLLKCLHMLLNTTYIDKRLIICYLKHFKSDTKLYLNTIVVFKLLFKYILTGTVYCNILSLHCLYKHTLMSATHGLYTIFSYFIDDTLYDNIEDYRHITTTKLCNYIDYNTLCDNYDMLTSLRKNNLLWLVDYEKIIKNETVENIFKDVITTYFDRSV